MASPHAAGVAALIVVAARQAGQGKRRPDASPDKVESFLKKTVDQDPVPGGQPSTEYPNEGRDPAFTAFCEGNTNKNGFYGRGIVSAISAVS